MADFPKIVALLPMKAHSERVTSKNFRDLSGIPLYQWTLRTLISLEEVAAVIINTDARRLLLDHGLDAMDGRGRVMVRERRPEICGDFVSMNLIVADDLAHSDADIYIMTHTTNPLLSGQTIRKALAAYHEAIRSDRADSLFAVNRVQTRFYREDGSPVNHDPRQLLRTQDLEPWFEENSNLYIFSKGSFAQTGARIGARPILFETPPLESLDIDGPDDWHMAEALAGYSRNKATGE